MYGSGKLGTHYPDEDGSTNYEITDHLGNVRALIRDNVNIYVATMEDNDVEHENDPFANPRVEEMQYFENLFETEAEDNFMNVTPNSERVADARNVSYLYWNDNAGTTKEEKAIGPSIALKVSTGDKVSLKAWARFEERQSYARDFNLAALASMLGNTFVAQQGFEGYTVPQTTDNILGALTTGGYGNDTDNTVPFAYLNYIIYDEDMEAVDFDAVRVPADAGSETSSLYLPGNEPIEFGFADEIIIPQNGYIYIWLSNESKNTRVWFDDLTVTHTQSLVVQASDYGVWGDVLREQRADAKKYRFGYQGQFAEKDEETGWSHFELREYDASIARFLQIDPMSQFYSPYIGIGNCPTMNVDKTGGVAGPPWWGTWFFGAELNFSAGMGTGYGTFVQSGWAEDQIGYIRYSMSGTLNSFEGKKPNAIQDGAVFGLDIGLDLIGAWDFGQGDFVTSINETLDFTYALSVGLVDFKFAPGQKYIGFEGGASWGYGCFRINANQLSFAAVVFDELLTATGLTDVEMGQYEIGQNKMLRFFDNISKEWYDTAIHMNEIAAEQFMSDKYMEGRQEYLQK